MKEKSFFKNNIKKDYEYVSKLTEQSASYYLGKRYIFCTCHLRKPITEQKSPGGVGVCLKL